MKNILKELRVSHYIKNILIFLPLVFSLNLTNLKQALLSFMTFMAFCAGSSAVYILNDILDAPRDRLHPIKKYRPIALGTVSVRFGVFLSVLCVAAAFAFSLCAGRAPALLLMSYTALNIIYSLALKHLPIIDVFCVMAGFILRVAAGAAAINVHVSDWLLLTIMALSLFLGFGKRRGELRRLEYSPDPAKTRASLAHYSLPFLDKAAYSMMTLSIIFYALWTIDKQTAAHLSSPNLVYTVPLVIAGLLRYAQLLENPGLDGDPTTVILHDMPICIIIAVYAVTVVLCVYL